MGIPTPPRRNVWEERITKIVQLFFIILDVF